MPPYVATISLILATPVQFIIGAGFYKGFWAALRLKTFNMDSLIAIGTSTAYFYSAINYFRGVHEIYFETAALLIAFVMLGKWLEARAKGRTGDAIKKLMGLAAKTARVMKNGEAVDVPIEQVEAGDKIGRASCRERVYGLV